MNGCVSVCDVNPLKWAWFLCCFYQRWTGMLMLSDNQSPACGWIRLCVCVCVCVSVGARLNIYTLNLWKSDTWPAVLKETQQLFLSKCLRSFFVNLTILSLFKIVFLFNQENLIEINLFQECPGQEKAAALFTKLLKQWAAIHTNITHGILRPTQRPILPILRAVPEHGWPRMKFIESCGYQDHEHLNIWKSFAWIRRKQ